ncbi:MAG: TauD/TfdA family dioxygenase [Actinobacteria bacterium]|nr:TauD/TfdA family dioxygenase [Actinomycetota bacterium]
MANIIGGPAARIIGGPAARIIGGPAAWRGCDIADHDDWKIELTATHRAELLAALASVDHPSVDHPSVDHPGIGLRDITRENFPLPTLGPVLADVVTELVDGRGFVLLRGVPIEGLDERSIELMYWGIGQHVGAPLHQQGPDDLLVHIRDMGLDPDDPLVRGFQTSARLDYHADSSDVVGLLCVRPAKSGGVSTIISSVAVHDELVRTRPDVAERLHDQWWHDRRSGEGAESFFRCSVFAEHDGRLFAHYGRQYMESASRGPGVPEMTAEQVAALDALDAVANAPEFVLNMDFRVGDIQFLNNYTVMHARTDYVDHPEPERRRDLIRLWLTLRGDFSLPPDFEAGGIVSRDAALGD